MLLDYATCFLWASIAGSVMDVYRGSETGSANILEGR